MWLEQPRPEQKDHIMTRRSILLTSACALALAQTFCLAAKPPKNLLRNTGFEAVKDGVVQNWGTRPYWSGAFESVAGKELAHGGGRCARLTAAAKGGKHWGRILHSPTVRPEHWVRHRFSVWARGKGEFLLGCIRYARTEEDKPLYLYLWQETPTPLSDEWREVTLEFSVENPTVRSIALCVEVRGEGAEAYVDDAAFVQYESPDFELAVTPRHAMAPQGGAIDIRITGRDQGEPPAARELKIVVTPPGGAPQAADLALDEFGHAAYRFEAGGEEGTDATRLFVIHPGSGAVRQTSVDVVDKKTYEAFEKAAAKAKLSPVPAHILFIGDSLTDQRRGMNHVDKIEFWLQQSLGPKVTIKNVAVGGDYISRVWQRLNKVGKTYRLDDYDGIFEPKPTHAFIFLGHNDSKVSSASDYTKHCVAPETFDKEYRLTVDKVRQETGARITVISATSSVFEITKATAEKRAAVGKRHNLFGKPEELEKFNAIARKIAADMGCDYLDVYEPTRAHPDKPSLFTADGVHVNNNGNRFLALEILKHLGRE